MNKENLHRMEFEVEAMNYQAAGKASSKIKKVLQQIGVHSAVIRKISIVSYELEMNLVIHGHGGKLIVEITPSEVTVRAIDEGPGIPDINKAMEEGFSTADEKIRELGFGAGMGLPNIKKNSDNLNIISTVGKGTSVKVVIKV